MLMEAFMYRCHPQTARLVELVRGKAVGEVRVIEARFAFAAGSTPSRGSSERAGRRRHPRRGLLPGLHGPAHRRGGAREGLADPLEVKGVAHLGETGVDEYASAVMRFPGDIVAELATGVTVGRENAVRVIGTAGRDHPDQRLGGQPQDPGLPELTVAVKARRSCG